MQSESRLSGHLASKAGLFSREGPVEAVLRGAVTLRKPYPSPWHTCVISIALHPDRDPHIDVSLPIQSVFQAYYRLFRRLGVCVSVSSSQSSVPPVD